MNVTIWAAVSIFFVLIILALIALATPPGIILVVGIIGTIISIAIYVKEIGGKHEGP